MAIRILIEKFGHCSNCSYYEASTIAPDGIRRSAESSERGSKDEAIGRLILDNPDIFGEFEIEYEGEAKVEHEYFDGIVRRALATPST